MKCRRCRGPAVIDVRRHNAAFCRDCLRAPLPRAGRRAIDAPHARAGRASGRRLGRQGLARAWALLARTRLRGRRPLPRPRYRRLLRRVRRVRVDVRAPKLGWPLHRGRLGHVRLRRPDRRKRGRGVRLCRRCGLSKRHLFNSAAVERGYDVRRDRAQPRRRGRGAPRQRLALGGRLPRPSAPGAARGSRLRAQGQAARAVGRAGDGGLLRPRRASTTSSRSARWRPAIGTSATRRR